MSFDLLETVKGLFTGDVVSQAASQLGESESGIQKAIGGIVPTVLTGLLQKAGSGAQDATGALNIAKEAGGANTSGSILNVLQGNAGGLLSKGTELLRGLFGDKIGAITGAIASYAGIKESSAGALLNAAAPATLGAVGQHAEQNNLSGAGFLELLNSQKDKILAAVPSGLNLAGLLGLGSLTDVGKRLSGLVTGFAGNAADKVSDVASGAATRASSGGRWIWSLLLIIVAIILLWYLIKGCGGSKTSDTVTTDTAAVSEQVDTAVSQVSTPDAAAARESIQVTLPDGIVLNAYKGGIEDQLVTFLKDDSKKPGKDVWFDFDNLNFKTGSTEITQESQVQIQNIAAILKAFPKAKIKIGGYTDRTGDSVGNVKLSQSRAAAVEGGLKKLNANAGQLLGAEGYGSQFAKAEATAPDEERKKDRHISISVREK
jgi:outer membrane protein OmpA-like peptidoglycan-associated protein